MRPGAALLLPIRMLLLLLRLLPTGLFLLLLLTGILLTGLLLLLMWRRQRLEAMIAGLRQGEQKERGV